MSKNITCPKCGKETIVNKNGLIRKHARKMQKIISDQPRNNCNATGKLYEKLTTHLKIKPKQK